MTPGQLIVRAGDVSGRVVGPVLRARDRFRGHSGRLHFGCGGVLLPGWTNIDYAPFGQQLVAWSLPDRYLDLARRLPYGSGSATHAYSNNFLEHLRRDDALRHLRECFRVLRPGGRLRVVTPDAEYYARAYLARDPLIADRAQSPYWPEWIVDPLDVLNTIMRGSSERGWIHEWLWDAPLLARTLTSIGFTDAQRMPLDESHDPLLTALDGNPPGCFAVEAVR